MDTRQLSASWRVNYIGYEGKQATLGCRLCIFDSTFICAGPQDCDVTSWGKFGSCSKTCGGGVRIAFRKVLQPMYLGGTPCPALNKTKLCHTEHCRKSSANICFHCMIEFAILNSQLYIAISLRGVLGARAASRVHMEPRNEVAKSL
jgi:hypothetical protein